MTFFVDANVIVYSVTDCVQQEACARLLEAIAKGADGRTSASALEEVWHLERNGRLGGQTGVAEGAHRMLTPLVPVTDEAFALALTVEAPRLGASDRIHVGTCLAHGIGTIVTADKGFDHVRGLRRVDPGNARAIRRLVGSG
ncbi:type II toxin-antitoxin system VapC family toxin [Conexibacter woesei]|uniref:Ribonuclease VapC n=1 Tax=Conexibacter woesei (strain DSM 14684 / CCUG 47730 / CIP 108061 / JCM 11494 / NBRC 100937 / ID131577) TaxID=469383 RepID=D3F1W4_CONWI|nr:type II toxin-antitoxin system VapC family toxin [Conexibacter woesei]ADB54145.1 PilT protein domain protein [Conexibacter woesei DSM 14684]